MYLCSCKQTRRPTECCGRRLPGREVLLCVSQEATGWINIHVEQQQMPQSPSNARSSLPLHSHPLTSYHLHTSLRLTSLSLTLSFLPPLMMSTPHLLHPSFSISLSLIHLPFLYSLPMLSPVLLFSPSPALVLFFSLPSHHAGRLLAQGPAAYPPYSPAISPVYFSGGEFCVCSPPYCVISLIKWVGVDEDGGGG